MGRIEDSIRQKVQKRFLPEWFELENESSGHRVPPGSETHFRLVVVSPAFQGFSRVDRQRQVYSLLSEEREQGLHALALWTYTPEEWQKVKEESDRRSPPCSGKKQV
ncbi:MAG: BolA family transcriptional regulator [Bdellovibrio sp.]|nr:MAG: BolA family transcriptional regulator [Bdellovibrio sp.]